MPPARDPTRYLVHTKDDLLFRRDIRRPDKVYVSVIHTPTKRRFNKIKYSPDESLDFCNSLTPELFEQYFSEVKYKWMY